MPNHIPYTVLSQTFQEDLAPNGQFVDTWHVTYQGPSGTVGTIKIPASHYTPAAVDTAIQVELAQVEGVHALGSAPPDELGLT